ncbi:MAG: tetratricopeptide repeat protein [Bacteroidales bacterium]|nr:tetratricopeptide repeat protein [Bacteroidales bacterium]MDD4602850.1 tetratricopeptide repeat protein [Bacteroidales bacterium]
MKYLKLISILFISSIVFPAFAQQSSKKSSEGQQRVIKIKPVKPDTTDPNKRALNSYSKEKMFNGQKPSNTMSPIEVKAANFMVEGSKKGKNGDYEGAVVDFTKSLDLSQKPDTYIKRGYAYQMLGNYEFAIQDETEAIKLFSAAIQAYFVRGVCRFETNDYQGAKEDLDVFLEKERRNPIAFNYMAALLFMNKDFKGALENYDEVVRLNPNYPDIYTNRGMMRHYVQDYQGAILDYDEALKQNPDNASAYNNRAAAKIMLKDFQSALSDLNKAISLNSKYADAYDNRGRVKHALGDLNGACEDWQVAVTYGLDASKELIIKYCK